MSSQRRGLWCRLVGLLLVGQYVFVALAQAQVLQPLPPIDPTGRSGEPPPIRKEEPKPKPPKPLVPAPSVPKLEQPRLPPLSVFVREFRFKGNTVFTDAGLAKVVEPYVNREITTEDLEAVRIAVTLHYINNGYVTSGAVIPDQTVEEGVITLQVIEGRLARIDVEGTENFLPFYFHDRIELSAGPPVNMVELQERLRLLQQDPRVEQINAELRPTAVRGESELKVRVKEGRLYHAWLEFNNFQTPTVGAERGLATVAHENLTGLGDRLTFTYGRSAGVDLLVDTFYTLPITPYDTTLTFSYRRNNFEVLEDAFDPLEIESESEVIGISLTHPLYRTLSHDVTLSLTGEHLYNKTTSILSEMGLPEFIFVPGSTETGVNVVNSLRFVPQWVYRTADSVLAVRNRFSVGLDVLDATINSGQAPAGPIPDARFFSWLGQVQAVKRFDQLRGLQVLGRFDIQLADDRLFPLEQFPVGGRFTVRGYRENTFVRDNGIVASIETRIPVMRSARGEDIIQLAPFVDYGSAWNAEDELATVPDGRGFIASVGIGLRWNVLPANRARFEVYWGQQLNHIDQGDGNLQDHGVHLQAVVQAF